MAQTARSPLGDAAFDQVLAFARLDLPAERKAVAAPAIGMISALFDSLDDIEVGETPPATAFDARWE
jgi:hypothetical protein